MSVRLLTRARLATLVAAASASAFFPLPSLIRSTSRVAAARPAAAVPALDTAVARMGGEEVLRKIERVRFEMMTLWQRMSFDERPSDLIGSYELQTDLRNYALGAWRNTRRFVNGPVLREMTDIVLRDVAIRRFPTPDGGLSPWGPLSIAYVDERKELFAFAPERLLLAARTATDLRAMPDTTLAGVAHARASATIDGFPTTIFVRKSDGFLAMARYRAGQPNDFGLAPWGDMEVDVIYSRWAKYPLAGTPGVSYPGQWDVRRVGEMYKRLVVLSASFDAAAPADSFAISDSLRTAFASSSASRAMWDTPMDSAKLLEPRLARFGNLGPAQTAVKLGTRWLFLEGTAVPQRNATDVQWLQGADPGSTPGGLIITLPNSGRGGAAWFAEKKLPVYVAPGSAVAMARTMKNWKQPPSASTVLSKPQWIRMGGDSLWVESIDYPDMPGALIVYVPSLRWVYSSAAALPLNFDLLVARARARGWTVERVGTLRSLTQPFPARAASR